MNGTGIKIDFKNALDISLDEFADETRKAAKLLESRSGAGNDFLGWLDLPGKISDNEIDELENAADQIRKNEALVVVGIGGSYLGARAIIEALTTPLLKRHSRCTTPGIKWTAYIYPVC